MKRLCKIGLLVLCIYLSSSQNSINFGCLVSSNPCSGQGICNTKYSTCLCNSFYYGNACENAQSGSNQVTFVQGGITEGTFAGIIVAWVLGVFVMVIILIVLWAKRHAIFSEDIQTNNEKQERAAVSVKKLKQPKTQPERTLTEEKLTNLVELAGKKRETQATEQDQDFKKKDLSVTRIDANTSRSLVAENNPKKLLKTNTTPGVGLESSVKDLDEAGEYAAELLTRAAKYKMKSMNLIDVYSADSRKFVNQYDSKKDISNQVGVQLAFDNEEDLDVTQKDTNTNGHFALEVEKSQKKSYFNK